MYKFDLCVSSICLQGIPKDDINTSRICKDIAKHPYSLTLKELADFINDGYTFCPCTFNGKHKKQDDIAQMQLFVLDFDGEKGNDNRCRLSYDEALQRAKNYHIPVVISYETLSSVNWGRYRLIFLYNEPVTDFRVMYLINRLLLCVYPEADQSTSDISKMFYPGRYANVLNEEPFFFDTLAIAAETEMSRLSQAIWRNKLDSIRNKTKVVTIGYHIKIGTANEKPEGSEFFPLRTYNQIQVISPENGTSSLLYYKDCEPFSGEIGGIYFGKRIIKMTKAAAKENKEYTHSINLNSRHESCALLYEFCSGEKRLEHNEWWGLMLNMIYINGGKTLFKETLTKYSDMYGDIEHKLRQMQYCMEQGYMPMRCDNFCPFAKDCSHKTNLIQTLLAAAHIMRKLPDKTKYTTLEKVRIDIRKRIYSAAKQPGQLNVIKTQTGTGKTYAALEFMRISDKRVIVAFPNCDLMWEMHKKARQMGIEAECTPTVQEIKSLLTENQWEQVERYYANGADDFPIKLFRRIGEENSFIKDFVKRYDKIRSYKGHLFTTHARLLTMGETLTADDVVIIDEDISQQIIQMKYISYSELKKFSRFTQDMGRTDISVKLDYIVTYAEKGEKYINSSSIYIGSEQQDEIMNRIEETGSKFDTCVLGAIKSGHFYYDKYSGNIYFAEKTCLSPLPSYVMMSATADEFICQKVFAEFYKVQFYECEKVRYEGKVLIYPDKTYSRYCLNDEQNKNLIQEIYSKNPDDCFITFKSEIDKLPVDKKRKLYFGKALGTNTFSGENVTIIGTPHKPEYVYHLFADMLGCDCNDNLSMRKIQANGFEFYFMTYGDNDLRKIQLYMINTELEQAVGRARLICNNNTVQLFSGLPVEMSELPPHQNHQ